MNPYFKLTPVLHRFRLNAHYLLQVDIFLGYHIVGSGNGLVNELVIHFSSFTSLLDSKKVYDKGMQSI